MTTENLQPLSDADDEQRLDVLSGFATDRMFDWLTSPEQEQQAREVVQDGAAMVARGLFQFRAAPGGALLTDTESVQSMTGTLLSVSFGEDAPDERSDVGTWPGFCALGLSALIDWDDLADRLLRRYVPSYAREATGAG
jgi:hypothetical protein